MKLVVPKSFRILFARQGLMLLVVAALLLEFTGLVQYFFAKKGLTEESVSRAESELEIARLQIEKITESVEVASGNTVWAIEDALSQGKKDVFPFLRQILHNNPDIVDAEVAFVKSYKGTWYEPLIARRDGGRLEEMVIGDPSHDYFQAQWYLSAKEAGEGVWSEPYFDNRGGLAMVVTYATPVRDSKGEIIGVLGLDLSLDWLTGIVESIELYPNSYSTVKSREGQLLAAPPETLTVAEVVRYDTPLDKTGWKLSVVIPEEEIYRGVKRVGLVVAILQILGLILLIYIIRRSAISYMKLEQSEEGRQKIESELHIASSIQMAMIPNIFPPFPERKDLDMAAAIVPAKEVGGDLYDFFIREENLFFCIGDVSGKGVPAALVMAVTRSLFRSTSAHMKSPAAIMKAMNDTLCPGNERSMFVTFFIGILDLATGSLRFCNAGHNLPVILTNKKAFLESRPNLPLGIMEGMDFQEEEVTLNYGDALFLYTDGLTEAENVDKELFGEDRMMAVLSQRRISMDHLRAMEAAVREFVGEAPQSDDLTMLFIHFLPGSRHLTLANDVSEITKLEPFIEALELEPSLAMSLNLALEEAATNSIMYAYPAGEKGLVEIDALKTENSVEFILADKGIPFDPTARPEPDITLPAEERPIGGLGIFMVKNIMDSVSYERVSGRNILRMKKNLTKNQTI